MQKVFFFTFLILFLTVFYIKQSKTKQNWMEDLARCFAEINK